MIFSNLKTKNNINNLSIILLAFVSWFWVYIVTGNIFIALINMAAIIGTHVLKIQNKPYKYLYVVTIGFLDILASILLSSISITLLATSISVFIITTYSKCSSLKEWFVGSLLPFYLMFYIEWMQKSETIMLEMLFKNTSLEKFGYVLGILLIAFTFVFFVQIINNKRLGYAIGGGFFLLLGLINFFVIAFTEQPFVISDIQLAQTALGVLQTQALDAREWIRLLIGFLLIFIYFYIVWKTYTYAYRKQTVIKRIGIISILGFIVFSLYLVSLSLHNTMLLYNGHLKYGFVTNTFINLQTSLRLPADVKEYVIEDVNDDITHSPNVIIIMNEAFSDLGTLYNLPLTEDPLPYFHQLQKEFPSGISYSSVWGNNTCSSEWEALSSVPTALTYKGAMVYQDFQQPRRSLVEIFNSRGYHTVGLHPYYENGYHRKDMYQSLGFDARYFLEDMPKDMDTLRSYVTDEENYKYLIRLYEENKKNQPFFCFNVTMQNHGGYETDTYNDITFTNGKKFKDVSTYLSMLKHSDAALQSLISYFEEVEEDTIILFFGDHQPMVDMSFYTDLYGKESNAFTIEERKKMHATPYLIWANYDLNEETVPKQTSHNYLANILFSVGNIPKTTWLHMVNEYQEVYPIISSVFIEDEKEDIWDTSILLENKKNLLNDPLIQYQKYGYGVLYGMK